MTENVPYPHFNKGEKGAGWKIQDSGGGTSPAFVHPAERTMRVPLDGPCPLCIAAGKSKHDAFHSRALRNHEQAHVRFTLDAKGRHPSMKKLRKLNPGYFNAVEDIRMDKAIWAVLEDQPPIICPHERPKWVQRFKEDDDLARVLRTVSIGIADEAEVLACLEQAFQESPPEPGRLTFDDIKRIREHVWNEMDGDYFTVQNKSGYRRDVPRLRRTIKVAKWLQDLLQSLGVDPTGSKEGDPGTEGQGGEGEGEADPAEFDPQSELPQAEEEAPENSKSEGDEDDDDHDPAQSDPNANLDDSQWGDMVIERPLLEAVLPGRMRMGFTTTDMGTLIGDLGRWMVDQRIFRTMRRFPGGTVLLDCSGSMGLTREQVTEVMHAVPGVTFATYSGSGGVGTLRIIADKGRAANGEIISKSQGYNCIDGPALAWLGQQKNRPLVWVSDGWVNGRNGSGGTALDFDRDMLVAIHGIKWLNPHLVGGMSEVPRWLVKMLLGLQPKGVSGEKQPT